MAEPIAHKGEQTVTAKDSGITISRIEVQKIISQLAEKTATGDDQIPASIIKRLK